MFRKMLMAVALCTAAPAYADWNQATTKHFVIYSDGSEEELREAARNLEVYDKLLRAMSGIDRASSPIKVKVYLLRDMNSVERLAGEGVGGFYLATPRAPVAISARRLRDDRGRSIRKTEVTETEGLGSEILQHELTHHFMYQYFPTNYPTWYSEGFAEFYGSMQFPGNNVVELGHVPGFRMEQLKMGWLPMSKLLTAKSYDDVGDDVLSLYAQGWLLVHYAFTNSERGKQLKQYLNAVSTGTPYEEAAKAAFGDLDKLDSELRNHMRNGMTARRLDLKSLDVGKIDIRPLNEAEDALLRSDMFLNLGIPVREADEIASNVVRAVGSSPRDAYSLRILTEAHRAAEQNDKAEAAVDRWLAAFPNDPKAMMHKSELLIDKLRKAKSTDEAAWEKARELILKANNLAPQDPEVLIAYYDSFHAQGMLPPASAQNALMTAFKLVPQDDNLRQRVAMDFEARDMLKEAIFIIEPAAHGIHVEEKNEAKEEERRRRRWEKYRVAGQAYMETPRQMLKRLEQKLAQKTGPGETANATK